MSQNLEALGVMLKDARERLGLSQRDVETKAGVSNAYLSQMESGRIKEPSPKILHRLTEFYECSYGVAMELAGYAVPKPTKDPARSRFAARIGKTTEEEEQALLEYLKFLRSRKR